MSNQNFSKDSSVSNRSSTCSDKTIHDQSYPVLYSDTECMDMEMSAVNDNKHVVIYVNNSNALEKSNNISVYINELDINNIKVISNVYKGSDVIVKSLNDKNVENSKSITVNKDCLSTNELSEIEPLG